MSVTDLASMIEQTLETYVIVDLPSPLQKSKFVKKKSKVGSPSLRSLRTRRERAYTCLTDKDVAARHINLIKGLSSSQPKING